MSLKFVLILLAKQYEYKNVRIRINMLNFGIRTGALLPMFENVIWGFIKSL